MTDIKKTVRGGGFRREFAPEEQEYLRSLPAVESVTATSISYAPAFRRECMERYAVGESPAAIFREAGLDPALVGYKRIERAVARWRKDLAPEPGFEREVSVWADEDRQLRQELRRLRTITAALDGLVELADARETSVVPKGKRFELIERLRRERGDFVVQAACEVLGVTHAGWRKWLQRKGE